jgi:hypothetical protein
MTENDNSIFDNVLHIKDLRDFDAPKKYIYITTRPPTGIAAGNSRPGGASILAFATAIQRVCLALAMSGTLKAIGRI